MAKSADAFRTISEVAEWLDTPAHVLRFWESKFSQVKPVKRAGGRRYYRPQDMMLLGGIKKLLHDDGMTIKSVQKLLRDEGAKTVAALSADPAHSGSYALYQEDASPEPETEVSRVVSFKTAPESEAVETPEPSPVVEEASQDATLPFPSFLSGGTSMPEADAPEEGAAPDTSEPEAPETTVMGDDVAEEAAQVNTAPEDMGAIADTPSAEEQAPAEEAEVEEEEVVEAVYPPINIASKLSAMTVGDIRARATELAPIMDRIRAELDRTG